MRKQGQGTVRVLPSGRWQARAWFDGRQVSAPQTFDTKGDAQLWLQKASREIALGIFEPPKKTPVEAILTLKGYADRWLTERPLKPRTAQEYRGLLDRHILPELGAEPIRSLTPAIIRSWHSRCCTGRPNTRTKAYSLLKSILTTAEQDEIIGRNPCRIKGAGTPPAAAERPIPTMAQVADLTAAMPEELQPAVILAAWGGLRLGEVLGLRGQDVVLPVIHIRQTAVAVKGGATVGSPKTRAGSRQLIMPPHTVPLLAALEGRRGLLFPSKGDPNRPLATVQFYKSWDKARKAVGLPELKFHDLRHASATWAAQGGATTAELMSRLGHTSPMIAAKYQHSVRDQLVADRLSEMAKGATP